MGLALTLAIGGGQGGRAIASPGSRPPSNQTPSSGWIEEVKQSLAAQEYELSWQTTPPVEGIEAAWQAPNRSHGFRTWFTPEGIRVVPRSATSPVWLWGLSLIGYGRGKSTWTVPPATLSPSGHRIDYRRGSLVERYENTERGLEQLFTLPGPPEEGEPGEPLALARGRTTTLRRPGTAGTVAGLGPRSGAAAGNEGASSGVDAGELSDPKSWIHLDLALWGDLSARIAEDGQAIDFLASSGARVLRYAELVVTDARGERLPAWMEAFSSQDVRVIRLVIDASEAVYPLTVDPLATSPVWSVQSDQPASQFGASVATAGDVNADGYSDVIVGAYFYDSGQPYEGKAFLYLGSASGPSVTPAWTAEGDEDSLEFGLSVATAGDVNADGYSDVIVGGANYNSVTMGVARLYLGSASGLAAAPVWTAQAEPVGTSTFGASVATAGDVNGDGYADVIVGDPAYSLLAYLAGKVYLYLGSTSGLAINPSWTIEGTLVGESLGVSVSTAGDVNGDGYADLVIGANDFLEAGTGSTLLGRAELYLGSTMGPATTPDWQVFGNQSRAGYGLSVSTAGDVNGDGFADVIVGAHQYTNGQNAEGRAYAYLGSASGLATSPAWSVESNQAVSFFGYSVATAGDVNGDGFADVIVGAYNLSNGQLSEGQSFVYLGTASGLATSPVWTSEGNQQGARFGFSVATAGDVNGDGYSDVIVGASASGRASVFLGSASGPTTTSSWSAEGNQASAFFGRSVATAGDVNGDGYSDVIVGAHKYDNGQTDEGRAFLYLGSAAGLATTAAWTAEGNQVVADFGTSVATAGDVNCDGYSDVIVGADAYSNGQNNEGRAFLYLGSASGLATTPAWTAESDQEGAFLGTSVATAGDVNGDGCSDVIVGVPGYSPGPTALGRAVLYLGSGAGLAVIPAWTFESGPNDFGRIGHSVATAGDVNGDGYSDVIVGAPWHTNGGVEGRAYLFLGSALGLATTPAWIKDGTGGNSVFGYSVASAGDVNGDGYSDILVAAPLEFNGVLIVGRARLYLGSGAGLSSIPAWTSEGTQQQAKFGNSVASAGDVNGDGYSDVIVGYPDYDNGQIDEGRALLYVGSASGLAPTPAWTVESDQPGVTLGNAVASAGDVNGDGFSDVIVGADTYDNGQTNEGRALVYYGGGGDGLDRIPRQERTDGMTPISLLGRSDSRTEIRLRSLARTPAGRGDVRVVWEVKPLGTPFNGAGLSASTVLDTGTPGASGSAVGSTIPITGLISETRYHWRSRILSTNPFFPRSPWMSMPGDGITETKFRTAGPPCIDLDGDGYGSPANPMCPSLAQDCSDADPLAWGTPGETINLTFTSDTTLAWSAPLVPGAPASSLVYDVLRSGVSSNFVTATTCVESDDGPNTMATDSAVPAPGQLVFYLVRAQDSCPSGGGSLGSRSSGIPRSGRTCP